MGPGIGISGASVTSDAISALAVSSYHPVDIFLIMVRINSSCDIFPPGS